MSFQNTEFTEVQRQIRALTLRKINYSALARELGVSPQMVRRVALGLTSSARVLSRIEQEYRRIELGAENAA